MKITSKIKKQLSKDRKFIFKLIWTSTTRSVAVIGTLLFKFILARKLGLQEFGDFMLVYAMLIGLSFFAKFGIQQAVLRFAGIFMANKDFGKLKSLRRDVILFITGTSIFLGILFILFRVIIVDKFFDNNTFTKVILIMAVSLPFYVNIGIQASYMRAFKKPEIAPLFEVGLSAFYTVALVSIASWLGYNITPLIVSIFFLISVLITSFLGSRILVGILKKLNTEKTIEYKSYSGVFNTLPDYALSSITTYLIKFSPTIILGIYASSSDVGLYSIANSTALVINFVLGIVSSVSAPYFANYYKEGKIKELKNLIRNSTIYMMVIATPVFLLIIIFPTEILSYFGQEYKQASMALVILAVAQLFNVLTGPVYFVLGMTGHEKQLRNIVFGTALLSISSSFILIPMYGFVGATISTAIGLVIQNFFAYFKTKKILTI
ncbi:MAG: oligosaccharide flippase family protein [Bacteroidales bacterium]|nr:oligosaccharide flippase family protein [Bacteroidales bacterium]